MTTVAVVDYGLGNIFSVAQAAAHAGMAPVLTTSRAEISGSDVIILPGVGAFGDAMQALKKLDLVELLRELALTGKPIVGICLGMQLLMTESFEFGHHAGLGILNGAVRRLPIEEIQGQTSCKDKRRRLKVPHVGWSRIHSRRVSRAQHEARPGPAREWTGTLLSGSKEGEFMYFVHSYFVEILDQGAALAWTEYGSMTFCSAVRQNNVFGCQFHPERSGPGGLRLYRNIAASAGLR